MQQCCESNFTLLTDKQRIKPWLVSCLLQVHDTTIQAGAYPSPLNYFNFPKSVCTSVNEVMQELHYHVFSSRLRLLNTAIACGCLL